MSTIEELMANKKPAIIGLIAGLILGPFIGLQAGWLVSSGKNERTMHAALVKQQTAICTFGARSAVKAPEKLDFSQRYALAEKWSIMPGSETSDSDVLTACVNELAG